MSEPCKPPIYANRTVLTIGTVIGIILAIIGPVMWAAKKEAEISVTMATMTELKTRIATLEARIADNDVWRGKLDVTLGNMAKEISEIKKAVEK